MQLKVWCDSVMFCEILPFDAVSRTKQLQIYVGRIFRLSAKLEFHFYAFQSVLGSLLNVWFLIPTLRISTRLIVTRWLLVQWMYGTVFKVLFRPAAYWSTGCQVTLCQRIFERCAEFFLHIRIALTKWYYEDESYKYFIMNCIQFPTIARSSH